MLEQNKQIMNSDQQSSPDYLIIKVERAQQHPAFP